MAGNNVVALTRVNAIPGPDLDVLTLLKELLEKSVSGDLKGLAVAYVDGANGINSDWTYGKADSHKMVAAIAQLQYLVMKRKYEDD